jgi:hypothetical protein
MHSGVDQVVILVWLWRSVVEVITGVSQRQANKWFSLIVHTFGTRAAARTTVDVQAAASDATKGAQSTSAEKLVILASRSHQQSNRRRWLGQANVILMAFRSPMIS